jgi:hypothetical protein
MSKDPDPRTYVDRIFFDYLNGTLSIRKTKRIDCSDGVPTDLPTDKICLLINYKVNVKRGRKDRLRGKEVLCFPTEKGRLFLPLDEVEKAAHMLYSYVSSLKKMIGFNDQDPGKNTP